MSIKHATKKIYVAGPYRVPDPARNTEEAIRVGEELWQMGFIPYVPHLSHFWEMQIGHPVQDWLDYDMHWLRTCDAVFRFPGYSSGADAEVEEAERLGIPVFTSMEDVRAWYVEKEPPDAPTNPADVAKQLVYGDRNRAYGHPIDDFGKTALIWQAILGAPVTPEQVAMCMVGVKLSRQCHQPKSDNVVDGIGYLLTLHEVIQERARRAK